MASREGVEVPHFNQTHGQSISGRATRTYKAWLSMRQRCLTPTHAAFVRYGGRGITICPAWSSFSVFLAEMGEAPEGKSLDRKKNNECYCKANCRWATRLEQQQNRRSVRNYTINGETKCISEWVRTAGLKLTTVFQRLRLGWDIERALATKPTRRTSHG
jgi:hypothetical protein